MAHPTHNVKESRMPNRKYLKVIFFNCARKYTVNKACGLHPIFFPVLIIFKGRFNLSHLDLISKGKSKFKCLPEGKKKKMVDKFQRDSCDQ